MRVPLVGCIAWSWKGKKYHYCVTSGTFLCFFYNGDNIDGCISSHC